LTFVTGQDDVQRDRQLHSKASKSKTKHQKTKTNQLAFNAYQTV
jgi:hypothetical protein